MPLFTRQPLLPALLLSMSCLICAPGAVADIYKYVDSNGTVHLTDRPQHDGYQLIQLSRKKTLMSRINYRDKEANRKRFSGKIAEVANQYQVPEALLHAVITIESVYDPNAIPGRRGRPDATDAGHRQALRDFQSARPHG